MIKNGAIAKLVENREIHNVERHLVYAFVQTMGLDFSGSKILMAYFKDFELDPALHFQTTSFDMPTIKSLEKYLELIIPTEDRKLNGAFFTPDFILDFIIKEIAPKATDANLDPSCGSGAFLIGLTEYYRSQFKKSFRQIFRENIFGADILPYNISRAKILLSLNALQEGEIVEENDFNLYTQDSLRVHWDRQFDNIVGNPPYVKFQDLSDDNRQFLTNRWTTVEGGTFNLYFAFFELGYKLLKTNGKLGFITPNNYFTSLAGEALRQFFQQQKCITRIIDFNHRKVFDAQTYTAITFLKKSPTEAILFDRIKDHQSPEYFLSMANGSPNYLNQLNPKKWRLLKSDEQENIRNIESVGTPIGKLFDIVVGIATLKDEVFFVDGNHSVFNPANGEKGMFYKKETPNGSFLIEQEATKSVVKISDFKRQEGILQNSRRIICPYWIKNNTATPIPEADFSLRFPQCYAYLLSEKEQLMSRDKGKVNFDPFYVWGRTQGLTRTGKKILTPTFSQQPRFLIEEDAEAFFTNGYGIYFKEQVMQGQLFAESANPLMDIQNMEVVQKILNSVVMHYYVSKTSVSIEGGYPCYQKNFIEKFSIPHFTEGDINLLHNLHEKAEIDEFLIEKYQLNLPVPNLVA